MGVVPGAACPAGGVGQSSGDTLRFHDTHLLLSQGPSAWATSGQGRGRDHPIPTLFKRGPTHSPVFLSESVSGTPPAGPSCPSRDMQKAPASLDANSAQFPGLKLHLESIFIKCSDRFRCWEDGAFSEGIKMTQTVKISWNSTARGCESSFHPSAALCKQGGLDPAWRNCCACTCHPPAMVCVSHGQDPSSCRDILP